MSKETLQITKVAARAAYEQAPAKMKSTLETLFGKENLLPTDITERVKTFEDACEVLGLDPGNILSATVKDENAHKHVAPLEAFLKLRIISEALNEGWEPDWSDSNQYKYFPLFENIDSGFRFYGSSNPYRYSSVGSRLCFKNRKLSDYAGTQFCDLYNQMYSL